MDERDFLRHAVATLAYRVAKALRGAPDSFADFLPGPTSNTPRALVAHMGDLFDWALTMARDGAPKWHAAAPQAWDAERARFFASLRAFDDHLASGAEIRFDARRLFQGPVADALTHAGQLAMMRRLHGAPMKGENYAKADIAAGRVSDTQVAADPANEFD